MDAKIVKARYKDELDRQYKSFSWKSRRWQAIALPIPLTCLALLYPQYWLPLTAASAVWIVYTVVAQSRQYPELLLLAENGIPVTAAINQANTILFHRGSRGGEFPCLVFFSFDPATNDNPGYLVSLAEKAFELKGKQPEDPDLQQVASIVTNERAVKYRRRRIPISFTGGPVVYAADLFVDTNRLKGKRLTPENPVLPCIAAPGEKGALELLPWWVAEEKA